MKLLSMLATAFLANPLTVAVISAAYRPEITPDFSNPFTTPLNRIAGIALAVSLILMVIFLIAAVVLFILSLIHI